MNNKVFFNEFVRITSMIKNKDPISFFRYGDGEVMLINGDSVGFNTQAYQVDKWSSPNKKTKLGKIIEEPLLKTKDNWYYGIPCKCCNEYCKNEILKKIKTQDSNITYANLFVNSNYKFFIKWISNLNEKVILIANHDGKDKKYPFEVEEYVSTPDDCVTFFEKNGDKFFTELTYKFSKINNKLIFVSSGPLAKAIVYHLSIVNNQNRYIDVGSALDEYIHSKKTRPYMIEGTVYSNKICTY